MRSQRAVLSAFKLQKSLSHPYALMRTARIGVVNRYKYVSHPSITLLGKANLKSMCRTTRVKTSTSSVR